MYNVAGAKMHVRVSSTSVPPDAPVVVLLHGLAVSGRYMVPTAKVLAPHCRVYVPDLPGFGRSDKPSRPLRLSELSARLGAWLEAADLDRVALVGNSFGCQLAVDYAVRHPERVTRLVLIGPSVDPAHRTAVGQVARLLLDALREPPTQTVLALRDSFRSGFGRVLGTFREALQDPIAEKLLAVTMPTLVVRGNKDPIAPQRWVEEATARLPRGRLALLEGAHTLNFSRPEALVQLILPFLLTPDHPDTNAPLRVGSARPDP